MSAKNFQYETELPASSLVFTNLSLCACVFHLPGCSLLNKHSSSEISPYLVKQSHTEALEE